MTSFKREIYHVGDVDVISYELTDAYAHTIQLTASEALDLLTWLDSQRDQIMRDLHPEISAPVPHPPALPSWLDDLEL